MNKLPSWREVLSAAAIVVSLVFVGLEIRQNTAAQRSQIRQAISDQATDWTMRLAEDPELLRAWNVMWHQEGDPAGVTDLDSARVRMAAISLLRRVENVYLQYGEGVFDENVLDSYAFRAAVFSSPRFAEFWKNTRGRASFDTAFVRVFEEKNGLQ